MKNKLYKIKVTSGDWLWLVFVIAVWFWVSFKIYTIGPIDIASLIFIFTPFLYILLFIIYAFFTVVEINYKDNEFFINHFGLIIFKKIKINSLESFTFWIPLNMNFVAWPGWENRIMLDFTILGHKMRRQCYIGKESAADLYKEISKLNKKINFISEEKKPELLPANELLLKENQVDMDMVGYFILGLLIEIAILWILSITNTLTIFSSLISLLILLTSLYFFIKHKKAS